MLHTVLPTQTQSSTIHIKHANLSYTHIEDIYFQQLTTTIWILMKQTKQILWLGV